MFRRNGWVFRNRVGGVLAVGGVRNGGQELTIQAVQAALLCHDMVCVSDGRPTVHFGGTVFSGVDGGAKQDDCGLQSRSSYNQFGQGADGRPVGLVQWNWRTTPGGMCPKVHGAVRAAAYRWQSTGMTMAFTGKKTRIP